MFVSLWYLYKWYVWKYVYCMNVVYVYSIHVICMCCMYLIYTDVDFLFYLILF